MDEPWKASDPEGDHGLWDLLRTGDSPLATSMLEEFEARGWYPKDPRLISDAELPATLERVILDLSWLNVYLAHCDHLDDRRLYEAICAEIQENPICIYPDDPEAAITISLLWASEEGEHTTWLRFYASEEDRGHLEDVSDAPDHQEPPYRRDWMPKRPEKQE